MKLALFGAAVALLVWRVIRIKIIFVGVGSVAATSKAPLILRRRNRNGIIHDNSDGVFVPTSQVNPPNPSDNTRQKYLESVRFASDSTWEHIMNSIDNQDHHQSLVSPRRESDYNNEEAEDISSSSRNHGKKFNQRTRTSMVVMKDTTTASRSLPRGEGDFVAPSNLHRKPLYGVPDLDLSQQFLINLLSNDMAAKSMSYPPYSTGSPSEFSQTTHPTQSSPLEFSSSPHTAFPSVPTTPVPTNNPTISSSSQGIPSSSSWPSSQYPTMSTSNDGSKGEGDSFPTRGPNDDSSNQPSNPTVSISPNPPTVNEAPTRSPFSRPPATRQPSLVPLVSPTRLPTSPPSKTSIPSLLSDNRTSRPSRTPQRPTAVASPPPLGISTAMPTLSTVPTTTVPNPETTTFPTPGPPVATSALPASLSTSPPSTSPAPSLVDPALYVFTCSELGVVQLASPPYNQEPVTISINVGYLVESFFFVSDFLEKLESKIVETSIVSALECNEGGELFDSDAENTQTLMASLPVVTALTGNECTSEISFCTTLTTQLEFSILIDQDFDGVDSAALLSYISLQEHMDDGIFVSEVSELDRMEYLSPLPLLPFVEDPVVDASVGTESIKLSPFTMGAAVAMSAGGILALLAWARHRATRNFHHMALVENMSINSPVP